MWKTFSPPYFMAKKNNETRLDSYEIVVTDFVSIWSVYFSEEKFTSCLKSYNDGLEFQNDSEWISKGTEMLSQPEQLKKVCVTRKDDGKTLFISMAKSFGYLFKFECTLDKGSEELFFQRVTQQIMGIVQDLRSSETHLRHLLKKKDMEIEKYKRENGEIALRHLKTVVFDDVAHMNAHKDYETSFGKTEVPAKVLEMTVELPKATFLKQEVIETNNGHVKTEPDTAVKSEPGSQIVEEASTQTTKTAIKKETIKTESQYSMNWKRQKKGLNY